MEVIEISIEEALLVRHQVLWPDKALEFCRVTGDEQAKHFGVCLDDKIVSVASLYFGEKPNNKSDFTGAIVRLRKFATLTDYQGKGIGSTVFHYLLDKLQAMNVHSLWFDAREPAIEFYARFGCQVEGQRFYKDDISYVKMRKIFFYNG